MKQRKWTADEKLAIAMEGLKEKRSVVDICCEHQIRQKREKVSECLDKKVAV